MCCFSCFTTYSGNNCFSHCLFSILKSTWLYSGSILCEVALLTRSSAAVRLAPEETSANLTGYEHNGVTCIGMKTDIPVINHLIWLSVLDFAIVPLSKSHMKPWLSELRVWGNSDLNFCSLFAYLTSDWLWESTHRVPMPVLVLDLMWNWDIWSGSDSVMPLYKLCLAIHDASWFLAAVQKITIINHTTWAHHLWPDA